MARSRRTRTLGTLLIGAASAALTCVGTLAGTNNFVSAKLEIHRGDISARRAAFPSAGSEKLKQLQNDVAKIMEDPEKKKMIESWNNNTKSAVDKLKEDPEMKEFFDDVAKNGIDGLKKWEKDERILQKFSEATGGPGSIPGMMGMEGMMGGMGAGASSASPAAFKPGDEVIVRGLLKAPDLNGKKAMVVPPTAEERKTLEGNGCSPNCRG